MFKKMIVLILVFGILNAYINAQQANLLGLEKQVTDSKTIAADTVDIESTLEATGVQKPEAEEEDCE